jgi:hypothetical protein
VRSETRGCTTSGTGTTLDEGLTVSHSRWPPSWPRSGQWYASWTTPTVSCLWRFRRSSRPNGKNYGSAGGSTTVLAETRWRRDAVPKAPQQRWRLGHGPASPAGAAAVRDSNVVALHCAGDIATKVMPSAATAASGQLSLVPGQRVHLTISAAGTRRNMYGSLAGRLPDVSADDITNERRDVWGDLADGQ